MNSKKTMAEVKSISPLTENIYKIILLPNEYIDYHAGQYLQINLNDNQLSYSIANAPCDLKQYELHIRHNPGHLLNEQLFQEINNKSPLAISLPFGNCNVINLHPNKPIIFIAGGTGFSPIKAMIEDLIANKTTENLELFWSARSQADLYMEDKISNWQKKALNLKYYPLNSNQTELPLAMAVIEKHKHDLNDWQIVLSGPFEMAFSIRDNLLAHGALESNLFSDAFGGK